MAAKFGTSGLRGLAEELIGDTTIRYVTAFVDHLKRVAGIKPGQAVCIGWDLRDSSPRIVYDVLSVLASRDVEARLCGHVPTQALALRAMIQGEAAIMVTGSHIPADRNGIKFYLPSGEISKADEAAIADRAAQVKGLLSTVGDVKVPIAADEAETRDLYLARYLGAFPEDCLWGLRVGVYQHSTVARDMLAELLAKLGADVVLLGRENRFVPVDTEAVAPETEIKLKQWTHEQPLSAIVSADGDGDRPLVADENGDVVRGDVLGLLTSMYVKAGVVVTPVTSNSGIEMLLGASVIRTRVGSPYVISGMEQAVAAKSERVTGFEANGGYLTASTLSLPHGQLAALPTRDSFLPILVVLVQCAATGQRLSDLVASLQLPVAASGRLENFDPAWSAGLLQHLTTSPNNLARFFAPRAGVANRNDLDGLRASLTDGTVIHFRASGNAPEFRIYVEAQDEAQARQLLQWSMSAVELLCRKLFPGCKAAKSPAEVTQGVICVNRH